jgi:hypothetical protein
MGKTIVLCAAKENLTGLVSYAIFNVTVKALHHLNLRFPMIFSKWALTFKGPK